MTGVMDQADLLSVVPVSSSAPMVSTGISSAPNLDQVQQVAKQTGVKNNSPTTNANSVGGGMCDEKTVEYLRDLIEEKKTIENNNNKDENAPKSIVLRLLDQGKQSLLNIDCFCLNISQIYNDENEVSFHQSQCLKITFKKSHFVNCTFTPQLTSPKLTHLTQLN